MVFMLEDRYILQWEVFRVHISNENMDKWGHSSVVKGLPASVPLIQSPAFLLCSFFIFHRIKLTSVSDTFKTVSGSFFKSVGFVSLFFAVPPPENVLTPYLFYAIYQDPVYMSRLTCGIFLHAV